MPQSQNTGKIAMGDKIALVVDDDSQLLEIIDIMMTRFLNLPCETYNDPEKALRKFTNEPWRYSIVISDYKMPRMNGLELLARIKKEHADIPFVLISGSSMDANDINFKELTKGPDIPILKKPFNVFEFQELIERMIEV